MAVCARMLVGITYIIYTAVKDSGCRANKTAPARRSQTGCFIVITSMKVAMFIPNHWSCRESTVHRRINLPNYLLRS